jgi:hypothetical protein
MKGCRNCKQWQALEEFLDRIDPATQDQKVEIGLCRRYAPHPLTPEPDGEVGGEVDGEVSGAGSRWDTFWPRVASDDWCGEWDPKFD